MTVRTTDTNKELVRRIVREIHNEGNLDRVDDLYADECEVHFSDGERGGIDDLKEFVRTSHDLFSDFTVDVQDIVAEDDLVVHRATLRGTLDGDLSGRDIEAEGGTIELPGVAITRITEGAVREEWYVTDRLVQLEQLGVRPDELLDATDDPGREGRPESPSERAAVEVVRGLYEAVAAGDMETFLASLAPDVEWIEPPAYGGVTHGREGVRDALAEIMDEWDDFQVVPENVYDAGEAIVAIATEQGRYTETGVRMNAQAVHVYEVESGEVVKMENLIDVTSLRRAIGG